LQTNAITSAMAFNLGRLFTRGALLLVLGLLVLGIENPRCADENAKGYRVAVAFYGLSRSLHVTLPSIERHVFEVLDRHKIAYDVFWSSLDLSQISNDRSGEKDLTLNSTEFSIIRPCVFSIVSQSVVAPIELALYKEARVGVSPERVDLFHDHLQSIRNLLSAFHSMRTAHSMIVRYSADQNFSYDAVVVLRPDTAMVSDLDLPLHIQQIVEEERTFAVSNRSQQSIWIPDFEHWHGYNDRAAYGSMRIASMYLTRGVAFRDRKVVTDFSAVRNGETFLKLFLHAHNITFRPSSLRVVRVRADFSVALGDVTQKNMNMDNVTYSHFVQNCLDYNLNAPSGQEDAPMSHGHPVARHAGAAYFRTAHC
jgi:hypothetical protein